MEFSIDLSELLVNGVLLGIGLAMDAFSVSLANGLHEPRMSRKKTHLIAGTFGLFQILMPLAGWFCVHTIVTLFRKVQPVIPWIAFLLLLYIGGKMVLEGIRRESDEAAPASGGYYLLIQAVATSIDALSVGFTIASYNALTAVTEALIIGVVTYGICLAGLKIGKTAGMKYADRASIFGGCILILIGLKILLGK